MKGSVVLIVVFLILLLMGIYSYLVTENGPLKPEGRLAFVKIANPDFYPGHLHSKLLANISKEEGSKCALVLHFGGDSNYRSYPEGDVYIIEMAFIDTQGTGAEGNTDYLDSLKIALFGVPEGRYKYKSDGVIFNTTEQAMNHINTLAKKHNQQGPIPTVWHGTARLGSPIFVQGCGFPLYFDIMAKQYGIIPAYFYTFTGMLYPYLNNPYRNFELQHSDELQTFYRNGELNYE